MFESIFRNVFVITIERNAKRRKYIDSALKDIEFTYYYGLDLSKNYLHCDYVGNLPREIFEQYDMDKQHCIIWTKGQFGAFATEKKLIKDFALQNKNEDLIILLDDIVFEKNWKERFLQAYNDLPKNWDAMILSTRLGRATSRRMRFVIGIKRKLEKLLLQKKRYSVRRYSKYLDICPATIHGIFGIIYSPQGLIKLMNEPDKLRRDQDDILLGRLVQQGYLNIYIAYPQIGKEGIYDGSWTQINDFSMK